MRRRASASRTRVALSSGTAALHLGLLGLGVQPGDVVLTSTHDLRRHRQRDHLHRRRAVLRRLRPRDRQHRRRAAGARRRGSCARRAGASARSCRSTCSASAPTSTALDGSGGRVRRAAPRRRRRVARRVARGPPAGSFGVASIFSFNGNKIMTTSGGGMLLTDDGARRPRALPVDAGPAAGRALRAHRDRLQLPAEQHAGRARPGPAAPGSTT